MPKIDTQKGSIFFAQTGTEPASKIPVILIHMAGGSHLSWPPQLRRLQGRRVLAPDLPGHGRSGNPGREHIHEYAESILALMEALAIKRAHLIGHSMGGAIAQSVAVSAPEQVAGLVLIGSGAELPVNPMILHDVFDRKDEVAAWITKWSWSPKAPGELLNKAQTMLSEVPASVLHGDFLACSRFDLRNDMKKIKAPTQVIAGSIDKMTPPELSHFLAENIQSVELRIIEGGSHMMILEQAPTVAVVVTRWLESLP